MPMTRIAPAPPAEQPSAEQPPAPPLLRTEQEAAAAARTVADELASTAAARDAANREPLEEVQRIREAGLLPLLVPADLGGAGLDWPAVLRVIRPIIRADASIGHLLAYHHVHAWRCLLTAESGPGADRAAALLAGTARHGWFWGGAGNPRDAGLALVPDGDGYRVSGRKFFATGASVADRITASGTVAGTGETVAIVIDGGADGVEPGGDWDSMGQRLSASGSIAFTDVHVPAEHVLGTSVQDGAAYRPFGSLSILFFQLLLSHLHVGLAEGALDAAIGYARTQTTAWATSGVERATDDPYLLETLGELVARTKASDALVQRVTEVAAAAARRGWALTDDERGELAVELAAAKVDSTRTVLHVTSTAFELTGARATGSRHGFDRFWRNARTITLHDPVVYKAKEVGAHALTGAHPVPSRYS